MDRKKSFSSRIIYATHEKRVRVGDGNEENVFTAIRSSLARLVSTVAGPSRVFLLNNGKSADRFVLCVSNGPKFMDTVKNTTKKSWTLPIESWTLAT